MICSVKYTLFTEIYIWSVKYTSYIVLKLTYNFIFVACFVLPFTYSFIPVTYSELNNFQSERKLV